MKIEIICVGKLKKEFIKLEEFYLKRCKNYSELKIIELKDKDIKTESEKILSYIKKDFFTILFSPQGKAVKDSRFFYSQISSHSRLQFIIGGSNGVDHQVINNVNMNISLSNLIFPHQLFRIMLLEQIYRGYSIFNDHPYHKE